MHTITMYTNSRFVKIAVTLTTIFSEYILVSYTFNKSRA